MAFVTGGKHFGQYTLEHWYDDEYSDDFFTDCGHRKKVVLKNFHIIDEDTDIIGSLVIENGIISEVLGGHAPSHIYGASMVIDGAGLSPSEKLPVLMPAFVDLHAHFRESGFYEKGASFPKEVTLPSELIDSACLAAAAGGFGTVVCMANTKPPTDTADKAAAVKSRADALGLIDLYPVLSLTKNMEGEELSGITGLSAGSLPLMLSEDGKDIADEELFLRAMKEAARIRIPVSCHCDFGGDESSAVYRVIELGKKAGCHIHIAHVSKKETVEIIRHAKAAAKAGTFTLTCEVMPHNLCLTEEDAVKLGKQTWGRVNPPLRSEEDRQALIKALADGTVDAIATDHAPHTAADKEAGAPGFSGFETAFAAVYTGLVYREPDCGSKDLAAIDMKKLSSLMSANPARLLGLGEGLQKRGRLLPGCRADLVIADTETSWTVDPAVFKSRGKNSAFTGRRLFGKILMTLHSGRVVFE